MSNYYNSCNNVATCNVYSSRQWVLPGNILARYLSISTTARIWLERRKQRQALANLPPHLLQDIGISAEQAASEASKPFWEK